jgi:hypothetical protein
MVTYADVEKLLAIHGDESPVLSLYLEIPLDQQELRELPARAGDLIAAAHGAPAGAAADQVLAPARQQVRRILETRARDWAGHCAAIFAWPAANQAEIMKLPAGTGERAVLAARPHVRPLLVAAQRHPAYQVVVVDRRHAWLFSVSGDQVQLVAQPTAPGVPSPGYGGWYGLESYNVNERVAGLAQQHFEDTAELLDKTMRRVPGEVFVVGGHAATIPQFLANLGRGARDRYAGSFAVDTATMTNAKIRALADPVIATWVRKAEAELVELLRTQPPGGLAAVGMPQCLAAIRNHSIRTLALPADELIPGLACQACGALGTTWGGFTTRKAGCGHGHAAVIDVPDLVEELAVAVIADGGRAEAVADPPGGIAALLKFPLPRRG